MRHKFLLILPISVIGLLSCMPDSTPKSLTYEETLSYINNNYKELTNVPTGYVEYSTDYPTSGYVEDELRALGVTGDISSTNKNQIDEDSFITNYIKDSSNEAKLEEDASLSLMFLSPSNFPIFTNNGATYSYQLTYVKELVMTSTTPNHTYTRYYNTSLHLTRFEVNCSKSEATYTATQSFIY